MPRMPKDEGVPNRSHGRPISYKDTPWLGEIYASKEPVLPDEVWLNAVGFPNYDVSSKGRVRRANDLKLMNAVPRGRGQVNRAYLRVELYKYEEDGSKKRYTVSIHSLVARTFHGAPSSPDLEVAHLNGNNQDNRADNLRWVTHRENMSHQQFHGRVKTSMQCNLTRLCPNAVFMIRNLYLKEGWKISRIANLADLDHQVVERIAKGKSRAHDLPRQEYRYGQPED